MSMFRTTTASLAASFATTVALGLATFTFVMPAHAATTTPKAAVTVGDEGVNRMEVSYADIDLASQQGQAKLDLRLKSAARAVCRDAISGMDPLHDRMAFDECYNTALQGARIHMAALVLAQKQG